MLINVHHIAEESLMQIVFRVIFNNLLNLLKYILGITITPSSYNIPAPNHFHSIVNDTIHPINHPQQHSTSHNLQLSISIITSTLKAGTLYRCIYNQFIIILHLNTFSPHLVFLFVSVLYVM